MIDAIAKAFQEGGLFMYFIALSSACSAAIMLERGIQLYLRYRANAGPLADAVENSIRSRRISEELATEVTRSLSAPVLIMAAYVARAIPRGPRAIYDAAVEGRIEVSPEINRRTGYLAMFANVATLLGLLGTIIGLISAFAGVAAADPARKQQMLATGISVAMNTTAYGLMVAIPAMIGHSLLFSRTMRLNEEADRMEHRVLSVIGELHPEIVQEEEEA